MDGYALTDELFTVQYTSDARHALFTGCSLAGAGKDFSEHLYDSLNTRGIIDCVITVCCGKMLPYIGEPIASGLYAERLAHALYESGLEEVVVACPSCYYTLKHLLEGADAVTCPKVRALPEALLAASCSLENAVPDGLRPITVHDSCPDKEKGTFAAATRTLFGKTALCEMAHNRGFSVCCSSNPEYEAADDIELASSQARVRESRDAGAKSIVTYCMRCARVLSHAGQTVAQTEAHHYLEYLLSETITWDAAQGEADCMLLQ